MANGLTISITDPDVERYFMTIPEAVGLVIEASAMARRGETYVLEMGEPIKIVDIVKRYAAYVGSPLRRSSSSGCAKARSSVRSCSPTWSRRNLRPTR